MTGIAIAITNHFNNNENTLVSGLTTLEHVLMRKLSELI